MITLDSIYRPWPVKENLLLNCTVKHLFFSVLWNFNFNSLLGGLHVVNINQLVFDLTWKCIR